MTNTARPQPHRKFIAFVVAAAIAITGFSAVPARADEDVAKVLAGLAVLGILGAAINKARDDREEVQREVIHTPPYNYNPGVRPLPGRVARYDLPSSCARHFPRSGVRQLLLGEQCLENRYGYARSLPKSCRVSFWNGRKHKTAYRPACLRDRGYRIVRR